MTAANVPQFNTTSDAFGITAFSTYLNFGATLLVVFALAALAISIVTWIGLRLFATRYETAKSAAGWAALAAVIVLSLVLGLNWGLQWFYQPGQTITP